MKKKFNINARLYNALSTLHKLFACFCRFACALVLARLVDATLLYLKTGVG